jgi:hypothetical protein
MSGVDLVTMIIVSAVTQGATRVVSAPLDAAAEALKERVKARLDRTSRFAQAKAGTRRLEISDRIAFKAFGEAAFNDDELIADYLGGVLAGSGVDDDSAAAVIAQIGRLSALQLRVHYVVYRELRRLWSGDWPNLYNSAETGKAAIQLTPGELSHAAGADSGEGIGSALAVLETEGLISIPWHFAGSTAEDPTGATITPTGLGAELFLWGHGCRPIDAESLFDAATPMVFLTEVPATPSASRVTPPS